MVMNKAAFEQIKREKENLLPTPDVGTPVQWFDRNDDNRCYAAQVTQVQGPGKVLLTINKPNSHPMHKQGVLHRSHPVHEEAANSATVRNGAWDFLPGTKLTARHKQVHLEQIEKREAHLMESEAASRAEAERRKKIKEELASHMDDVEEDVAKATK